MTYYDTIEDDLKRAKQILEKGRATHDMINALPEAAQPAAQMGGTIFGADVYAAYMLLDSFVQEIERLRAGLLKLEARIQELATLASPTWPKEKGTS